jgi:hypothetical protein
MLTKMGWHSATHFCKLTVALLQVQKFVSKKSLKKDQGVPFIH